MTAVGDLKPGDTFVEPDGRRETRRVTAVTWTDQDDDVTGGGAVEIASVAVDDELEVRQTPRNPGKNQERRKS